MIVIAMVTRFQTTGKIKKIVFHDDHHGHGTLFSAVIYPARQNPNKEKRHFHHQGCPHPPTPTLVHMVRVTFASSSNKCNSSVTSSKSDQIIIYSKLGFTRVKGSRGMWTYVGVLWEMHQWTTRTVWVSYILRRTGVLNKNMYNWETKVTFARLWCLSSR